MQICPLPLHTLPSLHIDNLPFLSRSKRGWLLGGHYRAEIYVMCDCPDCVALPPTLAEPVEEGVPEGRIWTASGFERHAGAGSQKK